MGGARRVEQTHRNPSLLDRTPLATGVISLPVIAITITISFRRQCQTRSERHPWALLGPGTEQNGVNVWPNDASTRMRVELRC